MFTSTATRTRSVRLLIAWFGIGSALCIAMEPAQGSDKSRAEERSVRISSEYNAILILIGTEASKDTDIPADRVIAVRIGDQNRRYRALKEGDLIDKDQVVGRLEWQERAELLASEKKEIVLLEAELDRAQKGAAEAKARYETALKLLKSRMVDPAQLNISERKLGFEMYAAEVEYVKAKLAYTKYGVNKLQELENDPNQKYPVLRSPVRGVINSILKRPGDTVKRGEAILIIEVKEE